MQDSLDVVFLGNVELAFCSVAKDVELKEVVD
jgi:hypothetical protein